MAGPTQVADARYCFGPGTLAGDAGTGADAIAAVTSAGGAGVDRVVLGILLKNLATNSDSLRAFGSENKKWLLYDTNFETLRYRRDGSITCAKFEPIDWIAILPPFFVSFRPENEKK